MTLGNLRNSFLVPLLLLGVISIGEILFGAAVLLPAWQDHDALVADVEAASTQAGQKSMVGDDSAEVALVQLKRFEEHRSESAADFLSDEEADNILNLLYAYALANQVSISNLHAATPESGEEEPVRAFQVHIYSMTVDGPLQNLLFFLSDIKEATAPGVLSRNVTIENNQLTMELALYTSPYASGEALNPLPTFATPTPAAAYPTPLPTLTPTPTITPSPSMTPSPTITLTPTDLPTKTPTATPLPAGPVVGFGAYDDGDGALQYTGVWESIESQRGYGGSYRYSPDTGARVELNFIGTDVAIQYVAYKNFGIFDIYVDGVLIQSVDAYTAAGTFGQVVYVNGLANRLHTLSIRNTARRNPASTGNVIAIDVVHILESASSGSGS